MKNAVFPESKIMKTEGFPSQQQLCGKSYQPVIIFDRVLLKNSSFTKWIAQFPLRISVKAGESLKTLSRYAQVLNAVQKWQTQNKLILKPAFVAIGGGSVGDFTGFVASTYQRGCPLIQIPSTWLAAVDSAHGGKTGLNLNQAKNQIGSFFVAEKVFLVRELLSNLPERRLSESFGEVIKITLINQPNLYKKIKFTENFVWNNLEKLIAAKMQVVKKDPLEISGVRHVLNLGHTIGHVYESCLGVAHGEAVLMGMVFTARWSLHLGLMKQKDFVDLMQIITNIPHCDLDFARANKLSSQQIAKALRQDKKAVAAKEKSLRFVFLRKPGSVVIENKTVSEIVNEFDRQRFHA
jgi:3-dehydroquinate synthase